MWWSLLAIAGWDNLSHLQAKTCLPPANSSHTQCLEEGRTHQPTTLPSRGPGGPAGRAIYMHTHTHTQSAQAGGIGTIQNRHVILLRLLGLAWGCGYLAKKHFYLSLLHCLFSCQWNLDNCIIRQIWWFLHRSQIHLRCTIFFQK